MPKKYSTTNTPAAYLLCSFVIAILLSLGACKPRATYQPPQQPQAPTPEVKTQELTEEKAIAIAKNLLSQSRKTVSIQMHYWNSVMTKVACTHYDRDGGVYCSEPAPGAPYGYKNVPQDVLDLLQTSGLSSL